MTQPIHQTKKRVADGKGKMSAQGSAASPSGRGLTLAQQLDAAPYPLREAPTRHGVTRPSYAP